MGSPAETRHRLSGLDSVRGLAIILVVIFHYVYNQVFGSWFGHLIGPFGLGGVTLFFFLSGFLMERHLVNDSNLVRYFSRRFFRIVPAYVICLAVVLLLERITRSGSNFRARDVVANALLLQDIFGAPLVIGVVWSLLVEIKFYVLAPFVMRGGTVALRLAPYAAIAANTLILLHRGEASNFLTYLTFCFVGMQFGPWSRGEMSGRMLTILVFVASAATSVFAVNFPTGLAIFVLLNAAIMTAALRWSPNVPVLPFLGKVSYSWYLYHAAIGYPLIVALTALLHETALAQIVIIMVAAIVTLFIAWLSFIIIERPIIGFGYMFEQYLRLPPAPRPARKTSTH